jgi:hypothetical protein
MKWLKSLVKAVVFPPTFVAGLATYLLTGKTFGLAHQSMIWHFCRTQGHSNDLLSRVVGMFRPPIPFPDANGVLGNMTTAGARREAVSQLRERGHYIFPQRLPDDLCERLLAYALSQPCKLRPMDGMHPGKVVRDVYHRTAPRAVRYDFETQDLLCNEDIQKLLADLSFAAISQDYLGARPVLDVMGLWWHTGFSDQPDSEAAQYFHFDMDRLKWLKFFIYLTDVAPENGPHSFVEGTHRTGGISQSLLDKGYARLTDEEVKAELGDKGIIEFAAPRGTILAEDTRGLHKGKHVEHGDRLVLQFQFSNSLFGAFYPKSTIPTAVAQELAGQLRKYPSIYAAYV